MPENIHITKFGSPLDPRNQEPPPPGIIIHYAPPPHPEDVCVVNGIPVTSLARTLVDLAEDMSYEELREVFQDVRDDGRLDIEAVQRARARVEWRPSLAVVDRLIAEFR